MELTADNNTPTSFADLQYHLGSLRSDLSVTCRHHLRIFALAIPSVWISFSFSSSYRAASQNLGLHLNITFLTTLISSLLPHTITVSPIALFYFPYT